MARLVPSVAFLVVLGLGLVVAASPNAPARPAGDVVQLAPGAAIALATPPFLAVGKRYAFTWSGGGPAQTYTVKALRPDGWIQVEVADETIRTDQYIPGDFPVRWLNVGMAISIQEMRALP